MERPSPLSGSAAAFSVTYLVLQSAGVIVFWLALWFLPSVRDRFVPAEARSGLYATLALADAVVLPMTAILGALAIRRRLAWAVPVLWMHAGACMYAGLVAIGLWCFDSRLWLGVGLMVPVMTTPFAIAWAASTGVNRDGVTPARACALTAAQIIVFWGFFLGVLPAALVLIEQAVGLKWTPSAAPLIRVFGVVLFVLASLLGLASAWFMASRGRGTPLPLQPACELVTYGPYAIVRNPMAIAGIVQGLAVGLSLCSWSVLGYALLGACIWHITIRPTEEQELMQKFGEPYRRYRAQVRCWWPRLAAYRPAS